MNKRNYLFSLALLMMLFLISCSDSGRIKKPSSTQAVTPTEIPTPCSDSWQDWINNIEEKYQEAMALMSQGEYQRASDILQALELIHPKYRDVSLLVKDIPRKAGEEAFSEGDWENAIKYYEEARRIDHLYWREEVESKLFDSYINYAGELYCGGPASTEAHEMALDFISKARAIRPQDEHAISGTCVFLAEMNEAQPYVAERLYNQYMESAHQALRGQTDFPSALEAARWYYPRALGIYPDDILALRNAILIDVYLSVVDNLDEGNYDTVIQNFESIYKINPTEQMLFDAYILRGDTFMQREEFSRAEEDYRQAIELGWQNDFSFCSLTTAMERLGNVYMIMETYDEAANIFRQILKNPYLFAGIEPETELTQTISQADDYFNLGDMKSAAILYAAIIRMQKCAIEPGNSLICPYSFCDTLCVILRLNQFGQEFYNGCQCPSD